ncbi:MAG TPA: hypothetical protein VG434_05785 [Sphingomicrobium sp.]|nr:hypothetical protein [Sphingomicrobium sp.]
MLSVTILLLAAAALQPVPPAPLLRVSTTQSIDQFGSCFVRAQEQTGAAWSFVPSGDGGTFSDAGAQDIRQPYRLRFTEGRSANQLSLFASTSRPVAAAIERCR